ncbi:sulfatase-like hydrolase/transferase [Polaribacter sp. Asnod6-C07]|uniref:sulfatase-like hydrolase/transferase n=1 Tax=Polaribacter sp. Asnod6-C07 TaxID=3160582 RepID=UPI0038703500
MKIIKLITLFFITMLAFQSCKNKKETKTVAETTKTTSKKQPNIIFIFADDWGYGDLGIHGSTFCETPNLDKMAADGIDFQNFSVVNPVCSPSRVGMVTGQFPARQSVHGHFASVASHAKRKMPDWLDTNAPMLPRMLKNAGYTTAHFGKWHLTNTHVEDAPTPLEYGYDEYGAFNIAGRLHQMQVDSTLHKTIDFAKRNKDKLFFINAWIHATHTPHYPKAKYMDKYAHLDDQKQVYAAVVAEYDARIGELFTTLKELGIDDNTLVLFSSDNGPEITGTKKRTEDNSTGPGMGEYYSVGEDGGLKGRKRSLFAGGVRIPFIVRWPGQVPVGKVDKTTQLSAVDLLPTFMDLAGAEYPEGYKPDGESIVAAIKGEKYNREKPIYWDWRFSSNRPYFWPSAGIQDQNWKLLINKKMNRTELYDISKDWAEQNDVSVDHPEKVKALMEKLELFQNTLPENPPANTFSKERETLKK